MNTQGLNNEENSSSDSDTIEKLNIASKKRQSFGREVGIMKLRLCSHEQCEDCRCTRYKCFEKLDFFERKQIIKEFNEISSKDEQSSYLAEPIPMSLDKWENLKQSTSQINKKSE
ncbi:unnamed protein product [Psylliodes chrysocephalus]|uniref:Uncharacterized protein n=1 Tax=Psylliodes chrysocephalus TaxID=3402493 RepID=A0A9P0G4J3_9CUCU|nr:unnamed protein product [Psylliodes chrysocephala]